MRAVLLSLTIVLLAGCAYMPPDNSKSVQVSARDGGVVYHVYRMGHLTDYFIGSVYNGPAGKLSLETAGEDDLPSVSGYSVKCR